jgi:small subunit ribosomal protein S8
MSVADPIADMLTVIRNGCRAKKKKVELPASRMKSEILRVLLEEKFISNYRYIEDGKQGILRVYLKYTDGEDSVIGGIKRISTPGLRSYAGAKEVPRVQGGLGIAIMSTSEGLMTDKEARKRGVGGEVICHVW